MKDDTSCTFKKVDQFANKFPNNDTMFIRKISSLNTIFIFIHWFRIIFLFVSCKFESWKVSSFLVL